MEAQAYVIDRALSNEAADAVEAAYDSSWANALYALKFDEFSDAYYVEGFVVFDDILVEHGWIQLDDDSIGGRIVDPTYPDREDAHYYEGVRYSRNRALSFPLGELPYVWTNGGFGGLMNKNYALAREAALARARIYTRRKR